MDLGQAHTGAGDCCGVEGVVLENDHAVEKRAASRQLGVGLDLASDRKSNRRDSICAFCSPCSHDASWYSSSMRTRVGRVLMNIPTIDSTPASSAGRPETVVPNTTSRAPL